MPSKKDDRVDDVIKIRNAKLVFRNFSGNQGRYNPAGRRNFCVLLSDEDGEKLKKDGWNVKWLQPRNPDELPQAYIQVAVSYTNWPPNIWLVTRKKRTLLNEKTIGILDAAEIMKVDLSFRPYNWETKDGKGVKAYAKSMFVTIAEDDFAEDYQDVPDSAFSSANDEED